MNQAQALYHLQTIDLALAERRARLAEVDAQLGSNEHVQAARRALDSAESDLAPWRVRVRDLDLESKGLGDKAAGAERRLYSGVVNSPKELKDLQDEIASLRRRRAKLEDDLLEAMIRVDHGQAACAQAQHDLETAQAAWASGQQHLLQERDQLQQAVADLKSRREAALANVSKESLAEYNALRPRRQGQAVAELDGDACKRCGVDQTSLAVQQVRQGTALVHCESCGRILVRL